jgi:hypothetical protein
VTKLECKRLWIVKHRKKINKLYPKLKKIYGPYDNSKDGRYRVILYDGRNRTAKQYAKIKMEVKLGVVLGKDETVDHKDGNFKNDKYYNLEVRGRVDHINLDIRRRVVDFEVECAWCHNTFKPTSKQVTEIYSKKPKAGPFCSKSCIGKYGTSVQGGGEALDRHKFPVIYYTNKERK